MATDPVAVGLVGAGRIGSVHLRALQAAPETEVVGVVEPFKRAADAVAAQGVPVYSNVAELLAAGGVEAALVAAPSPLHLELVAELVAADLPVLCEKPVGIRVEDATEATRIASEAGVLLQVGLWRRFVPELRALRARIQAGEFGDIYQISCMQWDEALPSEEFRATSGGIAIDMGIHEFDQIRWLTGQEVEWVSAAGYRSRVAPRPAT